MSKLQKWENIIKQKRSQTRFRDCIRDIASNIPMVFYKGSGEVSRYPASDRVTYYPTAEYEDMKDDLLKSGIDYDFSMNFFENYKKLISIAGAPASMKDPKAINSEYAEAVWYSKNVYLSNIIIGDCENIFYTFYTQDNVKDVLNSVMVWDNTSVVYYSRAVIKSHKVFYSRYIVGSSDIWFSSNLIGCKECIQCDNLENQQYCIQNKQYEKEAYLQKKQEILKDKDRFTELYEGVNLKANNFGSENVDGNFCIYSENINNGYFCYRVKNARNAMFVGHENGRVNVLDTICSDEASVGDIYGCSNLGESQNVYMSDAFIGTNVYYCFNLVKCSNCIGCIGLKNKQYCIFNKQYKKEEWEELADKIFAQMNDDEILGEVIPASLNPFYFNDTLAYLIDDSFTKEEIESRGFMWRDDSVKVDIPEGADIIGIEELGNYEGYDSEGNWKIHPEILLKVIIGEKGNYYRIIQAELQFLEKYGLPLPRKHWLERIREGLKR